MVDILPLIATSIMACVLVSVRLLGYIKYFNERNENLKRALYRRAIVLFGFGFSLTCACGLFALVDSTHVHPETWRYHWFYRNGLSQLTFCGLSVATMFLAWPTVDTKEHEYVPVDGVTVGKVDHVIWDPDEVDEEKVHNGACAEGWSE